MLKKVVDLTNNESKGLNTNPNIFTLEDGQSPNMMNVIPDHDGSLVKRMGTNTQNNIIIANSAGAGFSPDSANILQSGLISYWNLNEATGTRYDSIGGNDLSEKNGVLQSGGIKNQAALFVASSSQYLLHLNNSSLETGNINFSLAGWFYLNSTSLTLQRTIVSKKDGVSGSNISTLLHLDTDLTDSSLTPLTFSSTGSGAAISTVQKKFGVGSLFCDDTADIRATINNNIKFGTGDFCVEMSLWPTALGSGEYAIYSYSPGDYVDFGIYLSSNGITIYTNDAQAIFTVTPLALSTWSTIALTRSGTTLRLFVNGVIAVSGTNSADIQGTGDLIIGSAYHGYVDEVRITKGSAVYTDNYNIATQEFTNPTNPSEFEHWLYVDTDNKLVFDVSSSGTAVNGSIRANSIGALGTGNWYQYVAWHDTAGVLGISVNLSANSSAYTSGVRAGSAPFVLGSISNGASSFFDGRLDETGFWKKVLSEEEKSNLYFGGSGNTYQTAFGTEPWASFDFGASDIRWLTASAGTGIYASSNLGLTWVTIATSRTANYQYFERSKNVLVAGSDSYDPPVYWAGSAGTFAVSLGVNSAPSVKYWINFQGFLIGLNTATRKRSFHWEDENTQITGDWGDSFDLPSSSDDEIQGAFVLRRRLYVSTRNILFAVDYVGGNPDWSFRKVKDFGFVSRTMKVITIEGLGEVAIGMDWDNKLRVFDGADDKILSDSLDFDNGVCEFAMDKISNTGSGRVVSFAELDRSENTYRLCLSIGANSTQTTHFLNLSGINKAFWPENNRLFNTMCSAQSANVNYLMAFDRLGYCHMIDSGNLDSNTTPVDDVYDSKPLYDKSPAQAQKNHSLYLYFKNNPTGRIYVKENINFADKFNERSSFVISGTGGKLIHTEGVDVPTETNSYQFRISSSANTTVPWRMYRYDFFTDGLGIGITE